jgi:hypothetical protein
VGCELQSGLSPGKLKWGVPLEELNCLFEGWISCCHIPGGLLNTVPWTVTRHIREGC